MPYLRSKIDPEYTLEVERDDDNNTIIAVRKLGRGHQIRLTQTEISILRTQLNVLDRLEKY